MRRPPPALRELESPLEHQPSAARRRYASAMSSCPKTLVPATRRFAPASIRSGDVVGPHASVDLDVHPFRQELAQPAHAGNRLLHERLSRVAGMDAHAEDEVDELAGSLDDGVRLGLGVEGDADAQLELARLGDHAGQVLAGLVVDGDAVAAGLGELAKVLLRVLDHQVAVEHAAGLVDDRRDRLRDDRADRDRLDEVAVTHVEVEDPRVRVAGASPAAPRAARSRPRRSTARSRRCAPTHSSPSIRSRRPRRYSSPVMRRFRLRAAPRPARARPPIESATARR